MYSSSSSDSLQKLTDFIDHMVNGLNPGVTIKLQLNDLHLVRTSLKFENLLLGIKIDLKVQFTEYVLEFTSFQTGSIC